MNKIYSLFVSLLFLTTSTLNAQEFLDVPMWDGTPENTLDQVILKDTTDAGERIENRVYRLERGAFYVMNQTLALTSSFAMVSAGDESLRPPVIIRGEYSSGDPVGGFFIFNGSDNNYYFENIFFSALDFDDPTTYDAQWTFAVAFKGNNSHIELQGCIFNGFQGQTIQTSGIGNTIYLSDNIFRNGNNKYHPFVGQQTGFGKQQINSLILTNNTFFNNTSFLLFVEGGQGLVDRAVVEHNTFYTSMIDGIRMIDMVNLQSRSNLYYAVGAYGDNAKSQEEAWYPPVDGELAINSFAVVKEGLMTAAGLTEADRVIEITNNAYFTPSAISDYQTQFGLTGAVWINPVSQPMFDDATAYPNLSDTDNLNIDPKFANTAVNTWTVDELATACTELRETAGTAGWGTNTSRRNIDEDLGESGMIMVDWPLVEGNHEITEASLLTAGHDGLPVGTLNWNASNRGQYSYPEGVEGMLRLSMFGGLSVNDKYFTEMGYKLNSYPNPVKETANIEFELPKTANVTISVYNIMGQKIEDITSASFTKGKHVVSWDASGVPAGIFIYKLETEEVTQSRQIIIRK
ncbi:MAG: T9SS type A sorting domain-containing protein [Bacteroidota bacterium]